MKLFLKKHIDLFISIFFIVVFLLQEEGFFYIPLLKIFSIAFISGLSIYSLIKLINIQDRYKLMFNVTKSFMFTCLSLVFIARETFSEIPLQIISIVISLLFWFFLYKKQKNLATATFLMMNISIATLAFYY